MVVISLTWLESCRLPPLPPTQPPLKIKIWSCPHLLRASSVPSMWTKDSLPGKSRRLLPEWDPACPLGLDLSFAALLPGFQDEHLWGLVVPWHPLRTTPGNPFQSRWCLLCGSVQYPTCLHCGWQDPPALGFSPVFTCLFGKIRK